MKELSIIIPAYNEELILEEEMKKIIFSMGKILAGAEYEILVVENGSTDRTKEIILKLVKEYPIIRAINLPRAGYGLALKAGLLAGDGKNLAIFNVDFWDVEFIKQALGLIADYDLVIGSKNMPGARDQRNLLRRFVTKAFNIFLSLFFGFKGTDTHGIKLASREKIISVVAECKTDRAVFDTEFVLRSQRAGLRLTEIPVNCVEKRKTRFKIMRSTWQTVKDLIILFIVLHKHDDKQY